MNDFSVRIGRQRLTVYDLESNQVKVDRMRIFGKVVDLPLFNRLVEVIGRDLFSFQSTVGEQRQERADGERACMRGVTKLLKAVLIGSPL